jgi:hypothetical protein
VSCTPAIAAARAHGAAGPPQTAPPFPTRPYPPHSPSRDDIVARYTALGDVSRSGCRNTQGMRRLITNRLRLKRRRAREMAHQGDLDGPREQIITNDAGWVGRARAWKGHR